MKKSIMPFDFNKNLQENFKSAPVAGKVVLRHYDIINVITWLVSNCRKALASANISNKFELKILLSWKIAAFFIFHMFSFIS